MVIQINTTSGAPIGKRPPPAYASAVARTAQIWQIYAASILRLMILVLVGLLLILMGLVLITGRVAIGASIIGSVLLIGLGAAQFGR
jgi:hypothetical protein